MKFSTAFVSFVLAAVTVSAAPLAQFQNLDGFKDQGAFNGETDGWWQNIDAYLPESKDYNNYLFTDLPDWVEGSKCKLYLASNPQSDETGYVQVATVEPDVSKRLALFELAEINPEEPNIFDAVRAASIDQVIGTFALGPKGETPKIATSTGSWEWDCVPGARLAVRLTATPGSVFHPEVKGDHLAVIEVPGPDGEMIRVENARFGIQIITPPEILEKIRADAAKEFEDLKEQDAVEGEAQE
ncbi:hypothetical protein BJ508DRAFT_419982 [Ascobolus immersus RN42]|uniref:Concanavalin A-like lectin/glucanase n=1 Tax=Ascobolus immersus RN42 TaxID=1160509 RepID=A0A3N4HBV8_ASCIM|nr:hypothetical protein BJ508DRAFT_419982 [Ascobolus immersus RN42]